jgi:magnesium transporter
MKPKRRSIPFVQRHRSEPGIAPGTVSVDPEARPSKIRVITYNAETAVEHPVPDVAMVTPLRRPDRVIWVSVEGLRHSRVLEELALLFGLHPLALEDVVNLHQRPKVEAYDDHLYCVVHMPTLQEGHLEVQQVSLFVGAGFVVTFQERSCGCLDPVRRRLLQAGTTRLRRSGADYLAYAIIDAIVDRYFPVLHTFGERLEDVEDRILDATREDLAPHIHEIRRDLLHLRRSVWPLGEAVGRLLREEAETDFLSNDLRPYLRDLQDHANQLREGIDLCHSMAEGLMEAYRSAVNLRANEVMRVLTVIATIFLPLSFIAGVYGMNFNPKASPLNMPELNWYAGYPFALALMAVVTGGLLLFFRRRGWLGRLRGFENATAAATPPAGEKQERDAGHR